MNKKQLNELLLQSLEHEQRGVKIYEAALKCVLNEELQSEWSQYLEQTRNHERILLKVCETTRLNPKEETSGRLIVRELGDGLVAAMEKALKDCPPPAAELVACECVYLAETKDHANWELLGKCAEALSGPAANVLREAYEEVEDQEDEHVYHTKGWCRELWLESLGLKSLLPPPEERQHVKTAIDAARAEQAGDLSR